jgi:hypothetical protein
LKPDVFELETWQCEMIVQINPHCIARQPGRIKDVHACVAGARIMREEAKVWVKTS